MSKVIVPTIGRIVLFRLDAESQEQAAIICNVHSDSCVNLAIFDGNGKPMPSPPTSVTLVQPGADVPEAGYYCQWMDYQIEKAASEGEADEAGTDTVAETVAEAEAEAETKTDADATDADAAKEAEGATAES